jgi:hypothetical protein
VCPHEIHVLHRINNDITIWSSSPKFPYNQPPTAITTRHTSTYILHTSQAMCGDLPESTSHLPRTRPCKTKAHLPTAANLYKLQAPILPLSYARKYDLSSSSDKIPQNGIENTPKHPSSFLSICLVVLHIHTRIFNLSLFHFHSAG